MFSINMITIDIINGNLKVFVTPPPPPLTVTKSINEKVKIYFKYATTANLFE